MGYISLFLFVSFLFFFWGTNLDLCPKKRRIVNTETCKSGDEVSERAGPAPETLLFGDCYGIMLPTHHVRKNANVTELAFEYFMDCSTRTTVCTTRRPVKLCLGSDNQLALNESHLF